jgi:hypothetical protein
VKRNEFAEEPDVNWRLLYKVIRGIFIDEKYHRLCDGQTSTLIIIEANEGCLFGGYTIFAWRPTGSFFAADIYATRFFLTTDSMPFTIPTNMVPRSVVVIIFLCV